MGSSSVLKPADPILVEKVISWLTGCAWTDVFFAAAAKPSLILALQDLAVALSLTRQICLTTRP